MYLWMRMQTREGIMRAFAREIVELNIKHYLNLLKTETDQKKRQTTTQLLAEEEEKLAASGVGNQER